MVETRPEELGRVPLRVPQNINTPSRNPKKYRHLRDFWRVLHWCRHGGTTLGPGVSYAPGGSPGGNSGEGAHALTSPWRPTIRVITLDLGRQGQSRALSVPIWRLGMQCKGLVRDPT